MEEESYAFDVDAEGLGYDLLDYAFNPYTQSFILSQSHLTEGMSVLDVGSGSGIMTAWLAEQVGPTGKVLSIDNSHEQLLRAKQTILDREIDNVEFEELDVYDIKTLNQHFDLVYCRFVLHHLHKPRKAIELFYDILKPGGLYIAEEGIISAAFSYPPYPGWSYERPKPKFDAQAQARDGTAREGDFGMQLFFNLKWVGFQIQALHLIQPLLCSHEEKLLLIENREPFKKTALSQGMTEAEWDNETLSLYDLVDNDFAIAGFYQSCQAAGKKPLQGFQSRTRKILEPRRPIWNATGAGGSGPQSSKK